MDHIDYDVMRRNQLWIGCPGLKHPPGKPWSIGLPEGFGPIRQTDDMISLMEGTIYNGHDDGWLKLSAPASFLTVKLAIDELIARGARKISVAGADIARRDFWHLARQHGLRRDQILGYIPTPNDLAADARRPGASSEPIPAEVIPPRRPSPKGPRRQINDLAVAVGTVASGVAVGTAAGLVRGTADTIRPMINWLGDFFRAHYDSAAVTHADQAEKHAAFMVQALGMEELISLAKWGDRIIKSAEWYKQAVASGDLVEAGLAQMEAYDVAERYAADAKEITIRHYKRLEDLPLVPNKALFDVGAAAAKMTKELSERPEIKALPPKPGELPLARILANLVQELVRIIKEAVVALCGKLGLTTVPGNPRRPSVEAGPVSGMG